ncbi:hypothetical protein Tco_0935747, partial [Tanacetum coccineum]
VMVAPIISIPTYSSKESDGDTIKIGVDIVHPRPDTLTVFPVSTIVVKLAQHEEELRVQRDRQRLPRQRGLLCVLGLGRGRPLRRVFVTQWGMRKGLVLGLSIIWVWFWRSLNRVGCPTIRTDRLSRNSRIS